jgi:signal transduction histidine kinase
LFVLFGVMLHQRATFAQRKDQQIRSFASLFAHMTRSRITGLALFIGLLRGSTTEDPEMVAAAFRTAKELDAINEGLLKIAYTAKPAGRVALATVMETIGQDHGELVRFDVRDDARNAVVASPQLHLILDELIRNAENAVAAAGRAEPRVVVRGRLTPRFPFGHRLIIEVGDNGIGMTPAVRDKATEPFFSLRAGSHVGLGLTSCAEMAKALGGTLTIQSAENVGTTVRISYPVTRLAVAKLRHGQAEGRIAGE